MQINVISAGIIGGELVLGLADGSLIKAGLVVGPRGPKGDLGPPGPQGDDGADGNTILNGPRRPTPDDGNAGDFWIDVTATDLWGPKEAGGRWPGPVHLLSEAARRDRLGGPMQRRQGGPSAFFGGTGPTAAVQATPQQGLRPIIPHGQPVPISTPIKIAEDARGPLFEVELRAESAAGVWVGSVRVASYGTAVSHTVFGEILLGTAPVLTFTPTLTGTVLGLEMTSNVALTKIEGVQVILSQ